MTYIDFIVDSIKFYALEVFLSYLYLNTLLGVLSDNVWQAGTIRDFLQGEFCQLPGLRTVQGL